MARIGTLLVGLALAVGFVCCRGPDDKVVDKEPATPKKTAGLYEGFTLDQTLLRKYLIHKAKDGGKDTKASSGQACEAARRIFSRVSFLFRTRDAVLEVLGDPATVSDYNEKAKAGPDSPLVYVFSDGDAGWQYTLTFSNGQCLGVKAEGLY